jgi:hypothetical protein
MLSAIRKRLTYANVAMTLALVFAMSGGAYAAKRYLITSTKQISPKVLKSLKGANGKNGANGANGTAGAAGTGTAGPQGPAGPGGPAGGAGTNGTSVTSAKIGTGATCKEGGSEFTSASGKTAACNGEKGATGEINTAGPLPSGKTEAGAWSSVINAQTAGELTGADPISFPIPLAASLGADHVHYAAAGATHTTGTGDLKEEEKGVKNVTTATGGFVVGAEIEGSHIPAGTTIKEVLSSTELELSEAVEAGGTATGVSLTAHVPAACTGTADEPKAMAGNICFYAHEFTGNLKISPLIISPEEGSLETGHAGKTGVIVLRFSESAGLSLVYGTWAVTG